MRSPGQTGSELLGDLGLKVQEIKKLISGRSAALESSLEACIAEVRKVLPHIR